MSGSLLENHPRAPPDAERTHPRQHGRSPRLDHGRAADGSSGVRRVRAGPAKMRLDLWALPVALLLALSSLAVVPAQAAPVPQAGAAPTAVVHATAGGNCQNATCDLQATLTNVQYFLIGIAVLLAGVAFAIYGIQHMLGSLEEMDPNKKATRNKQFYSIVVGLVIVLMSVVLASVAQGLIAS